MTREMVRNIVAVAILPVIVALALIGPAWVNRQEAESTRRVTCTTYATSRAELAALKSIARELGLPARFPVPEVPAECVEFLSPSP